MDLIHIIDDEKEIRYTLKKMFEISGYDVSTFSSGETALPVIMRDQPDVIILDLHLPGMDGLEILSRLKKFDSEIEVIMITGYADVVSAVKAIKLGARDYIKKPVVFEELNLIVHNALEVKKKNEQLNYLQAEKRHKISDMVGTSSAMQPVYNFIDQVAVSPRTTVLITGETGTGKGLVARSIHYKSPRSKNQFIEINCSAIQPSLLESELFGYEAGAFTGANNRKKGLLELAHEGTFFLDEIGDMSLELQSKVLKVLEEQSFRRVGGTKKIKIDIRIISASSKDLFKRVEKGTFRRDLIYRLNVATCRLPPLRDRGEDVILLAEHYLQIFNTEFGKNITSINPSAKRVLRDNVWIGNVRELRNIIERAVLFEKDNELTLDSIGGLSFSPPENQQSEVSIDTSQIDIPDEGISLVDVECNIIIRALKKAGGNQTRAAQLLGLTRETLKYRLKKHKIN
ncbi:MAG: sigma-54-dependent Fis family transcriptional regulator [Candidatus Marinimicrobia bacterium]|nr:sigma-54-dependent Fis family transcriptional regulator [Candidatus Neomarinimicrobiota bacterium]